MWCSECKRTPRRSSEVVTRGNGQHLRQTELASTCAQSRSRSKKLCSLTRESLARMAACIEPTPPPGRAVARTGLRMMPTFPPLSLKFRKAGFPRYGFKAGISDGAFLSTTWCSRRAVCIHPSCTPLPVAPYPRSKSRGAARWCTSVQATLAALPQGPSLRSELFCLGPSSLNRPHPPHSPAHRDFAAERLIRNAFAVPTRPRRPTSGSGLSLSAPSLHVVLKDPGAPSTASAQLLRRRLRPSPERDGLGVSQHSPQIRSTRGGKISGLPVSLSLRPAKLLASLTDLTPKGQRRLLRPGFRRVGRPSRRRV